MYAVLFDIERIHPFFSRNGRRIYELEVKDADLNEIVNEKYDWCWGCISHGRQFSAQRTAFKKLPKGTDAEEYLDGLVKKYGGTRSVLDKLNDRLTYMRDERDKARQMIQEEGFEMY